MSKFEEEFNYLIELSGKVLTGQIEAEEFETHRAIFLNKYGKNQQPEIPEFMANYIEAAKEDFWTLLSAMDDSNLSSRVGDWLKGGNFRNQEIFAQAWLNGYTVAKEKRFYLKHIDMSKKYNSTVCVLAHGEGDVIYGHYEFPVGVYPKDSEYIFTQSEIDSMKTGSYEQIEVEE